MTDSNRKLLATLLASLMMVSMVGAAFAPATAGASGPSGMLALGDAQVHEDIPAGADVPIGAADLEGAIYASDHADTLEAIVTTPERAEEEYLDAGTIVTNDEVALVLRDDEVHDGREVAVELALLETAVGFAPEVAYGVHESGEEWQSPIDKDGEVGVFTVPEFSDNTVTFSGGITLSGDAAGDGTTYEYQLDDLDGVDNFAINATGVTNSGWNNRTFVSLGDNETQSVEVGGTTTAATELTMIPGLGDPSNIYTFTGHNNWVHATAIDDDGAIYTGSFDNTVRKIDPSGDQVWSFSGHSDDVEGVAVDSEGYVYSASDDETVRKIDPSGSEVWSFTGHTNSVVAVDVNSEGSVAAVSYDESISKIDPSGNELWNSPVGDFGHGVAIDSDGNVFSAAGDAVIRKFDPSGAEQWSFDGHSGSARTVDVGPDGGIYSGASDDVVRKIDRSGNEEWAFEGHSGRVNHVAVNSQGSLASGSSDETAIKIGQNPTDPSISIGSETVISHSGGLESQKSTSIDLENGANDLDISTNVGTIDVKLESDEISETVDPVVEVNGHTTEHTGTLADGETTTLATNEAWLEEGTNTVTVSTNSPATGPESLTGFEYAHDASGTTQSVEVDATSWTESFNVTNTYPNAVSDANAVLTFSDRVAEIDDVEYRLDGGEWQSPPDHELNGTDLEVMIGDVEDDTTVDVRATGHKIRTYDGDVEIVEPTVEGDDLATEVQITDINPDGMFGLRVDGTELGDRIHYATEESWSGESAHVDIAPSGTQILRAPDANVGSTMTVRSSPISVEPESGGIEVLVEDGDEPRFSVREGMTVGTSTLDVTYYDTLPGERYVLWSATQDREIDADRASSPVYFTTDGSAETYTIRQIDREGTGGGGPPEESGAVAPLVLVLPAVGLSVTGLFWAGRRFGGATGVRGNSLLLVGSTVISAAALELVTPGSLIAQMWSATVFALGDAAASGLGAVVASIATLLGLWQIQTRTRADIPAWVLIPTVSLAGVLALESIRPGSVLGALEGVIAEIGALLALILVGFAIYRWRQRSETEREEASTPDTQVTLDLGDQGGDD